MLQTFPFNKIHFQHRFLKIELQNHLFKVKSHFKTVKINLNKISKIPCFKIHKTIVVYVNSHFTVKKSLHRCYQFKSSQNHIEKITVPLLVTDQTLLTIWFLILIRKTVNFLLIMQVIFNKRILFPLLLQVQVRLLNQLMKQKWAIMRHFKHF